MSTASTSTLKHKRRKAMKNSNNNASNATETSSRSTPSKKDQNGKRRESVTGKNMKNNKSQPREKKLQIPKYLHHLPYGTSLLDSFSQFQKSTNPHINGLPPTSVTSINSFRSINSPHDLETQQLSIMGVLGKTPAMAMGRDRRGSGVNLNYETEISGIFNNGRRRSSRSVSFGQSEGVVRELDEDEEADEAAINEDDEEQEEDDEDDVLSYHEEGEDDVDLASIHYNNEDDEYDDGEEEEDDDDDEHHGREIEDTMDIDEDSDSNAEFPIGTAVIDEDDEYEENDEFHDAVSFTNFSPGSERRNSRSKSFSGSTSTCTNSIVFKYPLPTKWVKQAAKAATATSTTKPPTITNNGLTLKFDPSSTNIAISPLIPPSSSTRNNDTHIFRSNNEIPPSVGIFYYEITIHSSPSASNSSTGNTATLKKPNTNCDLNIGFITSEALSNPTTQQLSKPPGAEQGSYALNGSDGTISANHSISKKFTRKFEHGDIIGCGVNFAKGEIFYVRNGVYLGVAFSDLKKVSVFPLIGLKSGTDITVNFGLIHGKNNDDLSGFVFDVVGYVHEQKERVMKRVLKGCVVDEFDELGCDDDSHNNTAEDTDDEDTDDKLNTNTDGDIPSILQKLVGEYFDHLGYVDVCKSFQQELAKERKFELDEVDISEPTSTETMDVDTVTPPQRDQETLRLRSAIREKLVKDQDILSAISLVDTHFPTVFPSNPSILFKLKCQTLLKYIKLQNSEKALSYGQQLHEEYASQNSSFQQTLTDIFSLLAYENPHDSPELSYLLEDSRYSLINEELNQDILKSLGREAQAGLTKLRDHTRNLLKEIQCDNKKGDKKSALKVGDGFLIKGEDFGL